MKIFKLHIPYFVKLLFMLIFVACFMALKIQIDRLNGTIPVCSVFDAKTIIESLIYSVLILFGSCYVLNRLPWFFVHLVYFLCIYSPVLWIFIVNIFFHIFKFSTSFILGKWVNYPRFWDFSTLQNRGKLKSSVDSAWLLNVFHGVFHVFLLLPTPFVLWFHYRQVPN